jgi:AbrB family looped-hinge helix DNA binding protein
MLDMETTKLSSKGQVVLPKSVRDAHGWGPGTEFVIESTPDGVRLRAKVPFARTQLDHVFGSVRYAGPVKSLDDMGAGIRSAVTRRHRRSEQR